jgi:hypothetical protein
MHNMALLLQAMVLLQRIALLKRITLLKGPPAEPTVDLPVSPPAVLSSTPRALARRPMTFLAKRMAVQAKARGSGTRLPARVNAAACASNTLMHFAVTATTSRARLQRRVRKSSGTVSKKRQWHRANESWISRGLRDPAPLRSLGGVLVWRMTRRALERGALWNAVDVDANFRSHDGLMAKRRRATPPWARLPRADGE